MRVVVKDRIDTKEDAEPKGWRKKRVRDEATGRLVTRRVIDMNSKTIAEDVTSVIKYNIRKAVRENGTQ